MTTQVQVTPRSEARRILQDAGGRFFTATFIKRTDGRPRVLNGRTGVRKDVKGVGLSFNPAERGLMTVWDTQKKDWRMINLDKILTASVGGQQHVFYD